MGILKTRTYEEWVVLELRLTFQLCTLRQKVTLGKMLYVAFKNGDNIQIYAWTLFEN